MVESDNLRYTKGHFMNPNLLQSQFETLEPPENAIAVDIAPPPEEIAAAIRRKLERIHGSIVKNA
jgi:gluconate kinase